MAACRSGAVLTRFAAFGIALGLGSCGLIGQLAEALNNRRVETLTIEPARIAPVFDMKVSEFGVCWPFELDRPRLGGTIAVRSFLFNTGEGRDFEGPVGHEIYVLRGQTCHSRTTYLNQTAIGFDFSGLPPDATLVRALLKSRGTRSWGLDPFPRRDGCAFVERDIGHSLAPWSDPGVTPLSDRLAESLGLPLGVIVPAYLSTAIPYHRLAAWPPPERGLDVTSIVRDWIEEDAANDGFVFSANPEQVVDRAEEIDWPAENEVCPAFAHETVLEIQLLTRSP